MEAFHYQSDTCGEHGFALSAEGTCVRCKSEAVAAHARRQTITIVLGSLIGLVGIVGVARAFKETSPPVAATAPAVPIVTESPTMAESPATTAPEVTAETAPTPDTHAVLDAWKQELARAEAQRSAELATEKATVVQQQKQQEGTRLANTDRGSTRQATRPGRSATTPTDPTDHPGWWQEDTYGRNRSVGGQRRILQNAGALPADLTNPNPSAWLPPNNSGNFKTSH